MADLDRDPAGRGPVALSMGGSHNRWATMTYEWRSDFEDAAVDVRHAEGLVIVVLASTGSHRCTSMTLAGHGPGQLGELVGSSTWHGTEGLRAIILGRAVGVSGTPRGLRIPPRHLARAGVLPAKY